MLELDGGTYHNVSNVKQLKKDTIPLKLKRTEFKKPHDSSTSSYEIRYSRINTFFFHSVSKFSKFYCHI